MSSDELDSLEETLEVISTPKLMAQIYESRKAVERGEEGITLEELRALLDQRP